MRDSHRSAKNYREKKSDIFDNEGSDMIILEEDEVEDNVVNNNFKHNKEIEQDEPEIPEINSNNDNNLNSKNLSDYSGQSIGNRNLLCLPCTSFEDEDKNNGREGACPLSLMQEQLTEQGYKHAQ